MPAPDLTRLSAPAPPPMTPVKVVLPLAGLRVRIAGVVALLLITLPASASEATVCTNPLRSSVPLAAMFTGVVTGRTGAVPTTRLSIPPTPPFAPNER